MMLHWLKIIIVDVFVQSSCFVCSQLRIAYIKITTETLDCLLTTRDQLNFQLNCLVNGLKESPIDKNILEIRYSKSSGLWDQYSRVSYAIRRIDQNEFNETELVNFEKTYFEMLAKYKSIISKPDAEAGNSESRPSLFKTSISGPKLKLPKIPVFTGKQEDWPAFRQIFILW